MKSSRLCTCLIAMLLISPAAFSDIIEGGDGDDWHESKVSAVAFGSPMSDYDEESGNNYHYTTVAGYFNWSINTSAYAWVYVDADAGYVRATAIADADAACIHGSASTFATVTLYETGEAEDDPDDDNDSGNMAWFNAYNGVIGDHVAIGLATIEEGSSLAIALAEAKIILTLG